MKILVIGSDYNWSIERIYNRELLKLGHEVLYVPIQNWYFDFYFKSLFHKVLVRFGLVNIENKIQKRLLSKIKGQFFDLIWVFKGMEIKAETLVLLKNQTSRLINFNPDNPFIFSGKGSGNKNITKSIRLFNEHFTYNHEVKTKIELEFGLKCTLLSFGFDKNIFVNFDCSQEIRAVCFIGNPDIYRVKIIQEILNSGISIHVYGHGWSKFLFHKNLIIHDAVYGEEYYKTIIKYRVQLNIMREHNLDSHNMRTMEIAGCGGIMLAPKTKDHVRFFDEEKEVFLYKDIGDLIKKSNQILDLSSQNAARIRLSARQKVLNNFEYSKLTKIFLKY